LTLFRGKLIWHLNRYVNSEAFFINKPDKKYIQMAKIKIQPLEDRVVVEPASAEEKTSGGIIIPDTAKEKPQQGKVMAVGKGKKDEPVTLKVGDVVLYGKYSGTEITIDGKDYIIMRESDIYAVI
jgi:chaperonin GroES